MEWLLLILCSGCFAVVFIRLRAIPRLEKLQAIVVKIAGVIRSPRISDHWKEKVLPSYAFQLFSQSLLVLAILCAASLPAIVVVFLVNGDDNRLLDLASSWEGITVSLVVAFVCAHLMSSRPKKGYGVSSRLLHQLVLGNRFLGEPLFDLEKSLYGAGLSDVSQRRHVFVAGLARAGTTILLSTLYETGCFCSLTYRDMPFVLAPNFWRKLSRFSLRKAEARERAHGDGLEVSFDSPEALEEVFWRTFAGKEYIKKDCLQPMEADAETLKRFRLFVALVLGDQGRQFYLSKNNNNILRLGSLTQAFPHARCPNSNTRFYNKNNKLHGISPFFINF